MKKILIIILIIQGVYCEAQTPMAFPFDENRPASTADDIAAEHPELYQKVVSINNGQCSGAIISEKGLVLTNYHCFFDFIFSLDSGLVRQGFYAEKAKKEIPLSGAEVEITLAAEDITTQLLAIPGDLEMEERIDYYLKNIDDRKNIRYVIKKFEPGDKYYLITYRIYQDIRLVCLPPRNAANFGGQSTNWTWPRYAADFCILRLAEEQRDEAFPFFEIRTDFSENEKVFSMGYPAETSRSQSSFAMDYKINFENKIRNLIRNKRVQILSEEISFRPELEANYLSRLQDISNYNLFIEGESALFSKYAYIEKAREREKRRKTKNREFISTMDSLQTYYDKLKAYSAFRLFLNEALVAPDIFLYAFKFNSLYELLKNESEPTTIAQTVDKLRSLSNNHYKAYDADLDRKILYEMLVIYDKYLPDSLKPNYFFEVKRKYEGDFYNYSKDLFNETVFSSPEKTLKFLDAPDLNILEADPAFIHTTAFVEHYFTVIAPYVNSISSSLSSLNKRYVANSKQQLSEANGTLRVSSGYIQGYQPSEAIKYAATTTFDGWTNENLSSDQRELPSGFSEMLRQQKGSKLCFLASLDVTAGNSGSPVLDAEGNLIGIVFDQNPEGMANQFIYDPEIQRATCISLQAVNIIVRDYFDAKVFQKEVKLKTTQKD